MEPPIVVNFVDIAKVLARDVVGGRAFFAIARFVNAKRDGTITDETIEEFEAALSKGGYALGRGGQEMVQLLSVGMTNGFGNGGEGVPRKVSKHAEIQELELFEAADVREKVLELGTVLVNEGHDGNDSSCFCHIWYSVP